MEFRAGLVTLLPQTSGNYPTDSDTIERERQAYNAAARRCGRRGFPRRPRRRRGDGALSGKLRDSTLYSATVGGAGLHPTTLGYARLAGCYADAINAVIG